MKYTVYDEDKNEFVKVEEPDPSISYTYADYIKWKFEERVELFKGRILKMGAPNTKHQQVSRELGRIISNFLHKQKCQVFIAPFDVRLPVKNRKKDDEIKTVVQPDLCVICDESKIDTRGCCGAPDLVIEILSPGNNNKEVRLKHELYEEAGVKEYWLVYPIEENIAVFLLNDKGKYNGAKIYAGTETIKCTAVPGLTINAWAIFAQE